MTENAIAKETVDAAFRISVSPAWLADQLQAALIKDRITRIGNGLPDDHASR